MIKLRKKSRKKVQWFLMLQEKKGEKLAIKRQVLPFWIIFPPKLFFPIMKATNSFNKIYCSDEY